MSKAADLLRKLMLIGEGQEEEEKDILYDDDEIQVEAVDLSDEEGDRGFVVTTPDKVYGYDPIEDKFYEVDPNKPYTEPEGEEAEVELEEIPAEVAGEAISSKVANTLMNLVSAYEVAPKKTKVVRGGQVVVKMVCPPGYKLSADGKSCVKMTAAELKKRSLAAKKAARKRKSKMKQIMTKRAKSAKIRAARGL